MKPTLIIAEDVDQIREELHLALQGEFEIVVTVADAVRAIDACRRHEPDLLLMDIVMPGMSGLEATRQLLAGPPPHPQVVLISEVKTDKIVREVLESGAAAFLLKTIPGKTMVQRLLELLPSA